MSQRNFYGLKDVVTGDFTDYFSAVNDEDAKRTLKDVIKNPNHPITARQKDLQLFSISSFDTQELNVTSDVRFITNLETFTPVNVEVTV